MTRAILTVGETNIELDLISITPRRTASIATHPVERGASIVDNVRPAPLELSIVAFISDSDPLQGGGFGSPELISDGQGLRFAEAPTMRAAIERRLIQAQQDAELLSYSGPGGEYNRLAVSLISMTRGIEDGSTLNLNLRQIAVATSVVRALPPTRGRRRRRRGNRGKQASAPRPESFLNRVVSSF